jgi:sigma-B regulation protein RsbU (phosphoserine phosphatase)
MFVTAFYGILNTRTGEVTYCNAGHNPPYLLRRDGRVEAVPSTQGLMLGLMENWNHQEKKITLERGDGIILYTDGITEALDRANNLFTEARLAECLKRFQPPAVTEIVAGIMAEVETFAAGAPQADDMTVLVLTYLG